MATMTPLAQGVCGKCGEPCRYINVGSSMSCWVHSESGDFIASEPERHDCNTYIVRESQR